MSQSGEMISLLRELYGPKESYYHHWYHSKPLVITSGRSAELSRLHRLIYRASEYFALHYRDFVDKYMPLADKEMEILEYQSRKPFHAGAFRPDWLIDKDGRIFVCEITSRFFAHGIFMSYYSERAAQIYLESLGEHSDLRPQYLQLLSDMRDLPGARQKICVLKSSDKTSAIGMYKPFYEHFGHSVEIFESEGLESSIEKWRNACVFSALNQNDILSYDLGTIRTMIDADIINDLRTVFLIHDKRFLRMWTEEDFTSRFLTREDAEFLRDHTIPTYICDEPSSAEIVADARLHKDCYIVKPASLGKSEGVHAGRMTSQEDWNQLDFKGMIVQPFVNQRTFPVEWEGQHFDEYICGMMLCLDDKYYGSGMVRTSSAPVTNVVDDRKMFVIESDDSRVIEGGFVL